MCVDCGVAEHIRDGCAADTTECVRAAWIPSLHQSHVEGGLTTEEVGVHSAGEWRRTGTKSEDAVVGALCRGSADASTSRLGHKSRIERFQQR